jgi:hypothetical protein
VFHNGSFTFLEITMTAPLYRVGFASCARIEYEDDFSNQPPCRLDSADFTQPVWGQIAAQHARQKLDAMLLLGDQVYSDYGATHGFGGGRPKGWTPTLFHDLMYTMYQAQYGSVSGFRELFAALKAEGTQIGAIWDDHDFGYNNGSGMEPAFQNKLGSTRALFDQFVMALNTAPTAYPPKPVLPSAAQLTGIERITNPIKLGDDVEIVLLDGRSHRAVKNGPDNELLGAEQWRVLKEKLEAWDSKKLMIVCLGSTYSVSGIFADQSWRTPYAHFDEFTRLAREKRIIFLSGDIHKNTLIDHGGFCEVISSGAHLPTHRDTPRFGVLDIYADKVDVKLFKGNTVQDKFAKTINRATGSIRP